MDSTNEQVSTLAQSLIRSTRKHPSRGDFNYELKYWVLQVIRKAEREKDMRKRARFSNLLKDLQKRP